MAGCKKRTVKFAKSVWNTLGPVLLPHVVSAMKVADTVAASLPDIAFGGHEKRKLVIDSTVARAREIAKEAGQELEVAAVAKIQSATRVAIEKTLHDVNELGATWEEAASTDGADDPVDAADN